MEPRLLSYKNSQISYYCFGNGPAFAFCFHGYGEDAKSFVFLNNYLSKRYTFIAVDLPFHGNTKWKEGLSFSNEDLRLLILLLIKSLNPGTSQRNETSFYPKITLIGFSLGSRIALSILEMMPAQIEKIVLLAPDGLKLNFWYWLATQTWIGNRFFALTMKKPGWFFGLLKLLNKLKLVNSSIFKFVNYYIGDKKVRDLLYKRWTTLRKLKPAPEEIKSLVKKHSIPVHIIYGKHDRIILPVVGEKFRKGIENHCTISVIHSGHQVLHEKHIKEILPALAD